MGSLQWLNMSLFISGGAGPAWGERETWAQGRAGDILDMHVIIQ